MGSGHERAPGLLVKQVGAIRMGHQMNLIAGTKMMAICKNAG
jgi:hypothetical protein